MDWHLEVSYGVAGTFGTDEKLDNAIDELASTAGGTPLDSGSGFGARDLGYGFEEYEPMLEAASAIAHHLMTTGRTWSVQVSTWDRPGLLIEGEPEDAGHIM